MKRLLVVSILLGLIMQISSGSTLAAEYVYDSNFDPNRILDDDDIFNVNGMTYERIVSFLKSKGTLADYRTLDIDGVPKTAPEIIWRVATSYKINPKYLIALLQKEQSLIEDPNPSQGQFDWATGYAICDSCAKDDPSVQEFKGFASQLEWAAKQHREKYLMQLLSKGQTIAGKAAGKIIKIDDQQVIPANNATAMLYSYTPHIKGNYNLWKIWSRWFSLKYPDNTLVKSKEDDKYYLLKLGQKRIFSSRAVMESLMDPTKAITLTNTELAAYPDGPTIKFPKFALLKDPKGNIWLLTAKEIRHIKNMEAFRKFSFNEDELIDVTEEDLSDYPVGDAITVKTEFPWGVVMQDKTSKEYWYIEKEIRHLIPNKTFLTLYFKGRKIKQVTSAAIKAYSEGDDYELHDGELVRGVKSPAVYIKENGVLRPIPSAEIFESYGWQWKNVVVIPDSILKDYPVGESIILETTKTI